jgi:hypothetical protein
MNVIINNVLFCPDGNADLGQRCRPQGKFCLLSVVNILIRRNVPVVIILCFPYYSTQQVVFRGNVSLSVK